MPAFDGQPTVDDRGVENMEPNGRRRVYLLSLFWLLLLVSAARAAPAPSDRFALVLGEATYQSLPQEPGCAVSAQVVGERLRKLGFDVVTRTDASNGEIGAALIDLTRRAGSAAHPALVVYFCGHAAVFDGKAFLLPVGAVLARPSDMLAEGLLAQSLLDVADRKTRFGLTIFDLYGSSPYPQPAVPPAVASFLGSREPPPGHVAFAVSETATTATATPLAQSLSAILAQPPGDLDHLAAAIRKDLTDGGIAYAVAGNGGGATLVAAASSPAAPPKPAAPKPALISKPATTPAASAPPAALAAAPTTGLPDEQHYSVLDRRRVQAALRLLGYYDGTVDSIFGPRTRAAIRHYQHDIGVSETGTLTPDEADRLVAGLSQGNR